MNAFSSQSPEILRLKSNIAAHNFQPRVPAGNSDGGQWTDGGGFGQSKPFSVDPI
jgi:hypothetical protein